MMFSDLCRNDYTLRDYQQKAKSDIFNQWDYVDNVLYQMPTGTGKTRLFTSLIRDISLDALQEHRRKNILIVAHRTELIEQIDESLDRYRIPHGIIAGSFKGRRDIMLPVQVASVQTITHQSNRELARNFDADFVIIDEAHHATANSYSRLWDYYPQSKKLGVTATPWRMDGQGFRGKFDVLVPSMSIKEFLAKGWLAPYQYYSVPIDSLLCKRIDAIHDFGIDGDFKTTVLEDVIDTAKIRAQLLDSYMRFAKGKKGIIYSISRVHSRHICQQYRDAGIKIADIGSETPGLVRKNLVQDFKNGDLDIIVNVDIFSEGFDCPDLEFVQLARPTRSLVKYIQQVGRGLRKNGDKRCIILDNVGMYGRFGLPDDDRPWDSYFEGTSSKCIIGNIHKEHYGCSEYDITKESDFSEGIDEMKLIHQIDFNENAIDVCGQEPVDDIVRDVTCVYSPTVFAKYRIEESSDGYYIHNIRSGERQRLCDLKRRKSVSIKIMRTHDQNRSITVISSFNHDTKPSVNDMVIGCLYREGRIIRFATMHREVTDIRI